MQPKLFDYEKMISRINKGRQNKQLWDSHLRECYRYSMPERQTIDEFSKGQKKRQYVFDSTAVQALEDYASRMESQLVPSWRKWFKLEAGTQIPDEQKQQVEEYLDQATDILFDNINYSNFNSQVKEAFLDLGVSTGAIIVEQGDGIDSFVNFRSVTLSDLILERSSRGIPETVWRDITVQAGDIKDIWPKAELTQELERKIEDDPSQDVKFIEGVAQRQEGGYVSMLIYEEEKEVLFEELLDMSPWIVFRESTISGEVYGRGRVMKALPDIKTLNKMVEDHLRAASFTANPIYTATDDGVINPYSVRLKPGTVMPVGSNDNSNPTLRPLPIAGDYSVLQYDIASLQDTIRKAMLSKPFGNIEDTPVRSATEMSIRNADLQSSSGSAAGRLQTELLERLISNIVDILMKAGKIVPMKIDGKEVTIKFTSPMARQQDSDEIATVIQTMEMMQFLPPEIVQQKLKVEEVPHYLVDKMGLPSKFKRSELEQKQLTEQAIAMQGGQNVPQ